jgi:NAD+ kinase
VVEIPSGGRVNVHRADHPVRIARVHASTFGDRLVAKFGLPVRGFRDARHLGPGHELTSARSVLARDIVTGDGRVVDGDVDPHAEEETGFDVVAGEGRGARTDDG